MAITAPRFTVDDLDHFPDDGNRYELLDGLLLVTPAPSRRHQVVVARLQLTLGNSFQQTGEAEVVGPGALRLPPGNQLQPDILVYPPSTAPGAGWEAVTEHWLAVEVLSSASRIYDRDFKRDAYLAMGVGEVWLVDMDSRSVDVFRLGSRHTITDTIRWHVPALNRVVEVDLGSVFAGID